MPESSDWRRRSAEGPDQDKVVPPSLEYRASEALERYKFENVIHALIAMRDKCLNVSR